MIFLSTSSGEVKGFAFKVISKVQFTGEENQQKDLFIYIFFKSCRCVETLDVTVKSSSQATVWSPFRSPARWERIRMCCG